MLHNMIKIWDTITYLSVKRQVKYFILYPVVKVQVQINTNGSYKTQGKFSGENELNV